MLVHGVTHRRQAWYPVLDELAQHREVILVDLPGHGQSPAFDTKGLPVVEALRAEFEQFLQEQGLDRPHVAGNSLGGRVALEAGAAGHACSVTALSPAGFWADESSFAYTRRIFTGAAAASQRLSERGALLSRTRAGRSLMYGLLTAHPKNVSADHARGDFEAFRYAVPALRTILGAAVPFEAEIPRHVPVTVAWAARDRVLPVWQAGIARERLPHAEHVMMAGVGHVPMFDNPGLVAQILLRGSEPAAAVAAIGNAPSRRAGRGSRRAIATA